MAEPVVSGINVSELYQVCIAVDDLEKSMEHYQNTIGVGPWMTFDVDPSFISEMTYHGQPTQYRYRAAFAMVGPMQLELVQSLEGDNVYSDFLKAHGEGVHHLGHVRVDDLDQAVQTWEEQGFPCLERGRFPGRGGYAYMDTTKALGVMIELLEAAEGPSPQYPPSLWKAWER